MAAVDLIRPFVQRMTIETALTPPIDVDDPFAPSEGPGAVAQGKTLLKLLKPKLTLYSVGGDPIVWAPYGEPSLIGPGIGGLLTGGFIALAAYGAYKLTFGRDKR